MPHTTKPPSARLVERVLEEIEPATRTEIAEATELPLSTTKFALGRLEDLDEVEWRPREGDARERLWELVEEGG